MIIESLIVGDKGWITLTGNVSLVFTPGKQKQKIYCCDLVVDAAAYKRNIDEGLLIPISGDGSLYNIPLSDYNDTEN